MPVALDDLLLRTVLGATIHFLIAMAVVVIAITCLAQTDSYRCFHVLWAVLPRACVVISVLLGGVGSREFPDCLFSRHPADHGSLFPALFLSDTDHVPQGNVGETGIELTCRPEPGRDLF